MEDLQDLGQIEMPEDQEEHSEEKGDEPQGERHFVNKQWLPLFMWRLNMRCLLIFLFWMFQERTHHMVRRSVPLLPAIWALLSSDDTVEP